MQVISGSEMDSSEIGGRGTGLYEERKEVRKGRSGEMDGKERRIEAERGKKVFLNRVG